MKKPICVIYGPVDVYSGYSANTRDKAKAIIELKKDEWDIKIIPCPWGSCRTGFIDDNANEWSFLKEYFLTSPLTQQPDYMFYVTIPPEAQPMGKWNCLITAGIETTACHNTWIEGINRMDLTIVSSEHSKNVFLNTQFEQKNQQGQVVGILKVTKPIEVVFEGANTDIYKELLPNSNKSKLVTTLDNIKENFCYLFVGHWMQGDFGEDRKNVSLLIKAFLETFKNKLNKPALILKTCGAVSSYPDRDVILKKIDQIKQTMNSENLPNIYLIHGDFEDVEMNGLYNHPKIKAMVSLTKGEGFGRPLLEFSLVRKPIIASNWSGHIDFLNKSLSTLIGGEVKKIHASAVNQFLIADSSWFYPNFIEIGNSFTDIHKNYDKYLPSARKQGDINKEKFSFNAMKVVLKEILDKTPKFAQQVSLVLPKLNSPKTLTLPKLQ